MVIYVKSYFLVQKNWNLFFLPRRKQWYLTSLQRRVYYLVYGKWTSGYKTPCRKPVVNVFYFICKLLQGLNQDLWKPVVKYLKLLTVSVE